jgi:hypothetical protein
MRAISAFRRSSSRTFAVSASSRERLNVLLLDDLLLVPLDLVRKLRLLCGQHRDLLDTLGIENVVRI